MPVRIVFGTEKSEFVLFSCVSFVVIILGFAVSLLIICIIKLVRLRLGWAVGGEVTWKIAEGRF